MNEDTVTSETLEKPEEKKPWGKKIKRMTVKGPKGSFHMLDYIGNLAMKVPCLRIKGWKTSVDHKRAITDLAKKSWSMDNFHQRVQRYFEEQLLLCNHKVRELTCKNKAFSELQKWFEKREVKPTEEEVKKMSEALLEVEYQKYDKATTDGENKVQIQD